MAATSQPRNAFEDVTNEILAQLRTGTVPWIKPWKTEGNHEIGLPLNCITGKAYSGQNILILLIAQMTMGYPTGEWCGLEQMKAHGGRLRIREGFEPPANKPWMTGQRATRIIRIIERPLWDRETGKPKVDENGDKQFYLQPKVVPVFNLFQFDPATIPQALLTRQELPQLEDMEPEIARLIEAQSVNLQLGGNRACYIPKLDKILCPTLLDHLSVDDFYSTLFHEEIHATAHKSRLDRKVEGVYGSTAYAFEELVAELGSAFLCARFGVEPQVRHADYIGGWIKRLEEDEQCLFRAAAAAQKAVDFMLDQVKEIPDGKDIHPAQEVTLHRL